MRKVAVFFTMLALLALAVVPAFAQEETNTIADIVVASAEGDPAEFSILLTAVQAADPAVLEALADPEAELTVFAPTDAAFGALIEALGEEAFSEIVADTEFLTEILLYHVVDGAVMSSDVVGLLEENEGMFSVETLQGQYFDVMQDEDGNIMIDEAMLNLEMVDIEADNGVVHVIDSVILPVTDTIADVVVAAASDEEAAEFTLLLAAVQAADPAVLETLADPEATLTVFAPTDAAFEALGEETLTAVLEDTELLTGILLYHVLGDVVYSGDLVALLEDNEGMIEVETAGGPAVSFEVTDDGVFINDAEIIMTDIEAYNGVIHVIDAVILPPEE